MSEFIKNDHHKHSSANSVAGQCRYIKSDGSQCKSYAVRESFYCFIHDPQLKEEREAAQKKGGKERSRKAAVLPLDTPYKPLKTAADVSGFLETMINQVVRGQIDPRVSNSVSVLVGPLLRAQQQEQIERRVEKLEAINTHKWADPNVASVRTPDTTVFEFVKATPGGEV